MASIPSEAGSEALGEYDVDFNVTYNRNGFVTLANTTVVDEVVCLPGQAKIRFSDEILPQKLPYMFPNYSVLIINGQLFGSECNFYLEPNRTFFNSSLQEENVGFMIIQSTHLGESALDVTIDGIAAPLDVVFDSQKMNYSLAQADDTIIQDGNSNRQLELVSATLPVEWKYPPESNTHLFLDAKITATATFSSNWDATLYDKDGNLDPMMEYSLTVSKKLECSIDVGIKMEQELKIGKAITEFNFPIPGGVVIKYPSKVKPVLRKLLGLKSEEELPNRIGLGLTVPVSIGFSAKASIARTLGVKGNYNLGSSTMTISARGNPLIGELTPSFRVLNNKSPYGSLSEPTIDGSFSDKLTLSSTLSLDVKPQVIINIPCKSV